jgi:hypothetical protein
LDLEVLPTSADLEKKRQQGELVFGEPQATHDKEKDCLKTLWCGRTLSKATIGSKRRRKPYRKGNYLDLLPKLRSTATTVEKGIDKMNENYPLLLI